MAMNSAVLITAIKARMTSELGVDFSKQEAEDSLSIMVEEIILHIQTFSIVNTTVIGTLPVGPVAATGLGKVS